MSKLPLLAATLVLMEQGLIEPDAPFARYAEVSFVDPGVTVTDVLEHRAGLVSPDLYSWRMMGKGDRATAIDPSPRTPAPGYSDLLPNIAICQLIQTVAGTPVESFLAEQVLGPAQVAVHVQYGHHSPDVHPAVFGHPARTVPLASELLPDQIRDASPAVGAFMSADGIARLLTWLLFDGDRADARLHLLRGRPQASTYDPRLDRAGNFALGFMQDMSSHGLAKASSESFGHTAAIAGWLAVVEPHQESVQVGYTNGILTSEQNGFDVRNALYAALRGDIDALGTAVGHPSTDAVQTRSDPIPAHLEGIRMALGREVLPSDCNFNVRLVMSDTMKRSILYFSEGALGAVVADDASVACDLTLEIRSDALARWLDDVNSRIGALIMQERAHATGNLWCLSAFEFWAARALH